MTSVAWSTLRPAFWLLPCGSVASHHRQPSARVGPSLWYVPARTAFGSVPPTGTVPSPGISQAVVQPVGGGGTGPGGADAPGPVAGAPGRVGGGVTLCVPVGVGPVVGAVLGGAGSP